VTTVGTITAPDASVWSYEITVTSNARLQWVLRAPDKTWKSKVAPATATMTDVLHNLNQLVAARSRN
jgi:hypothetical protein